MSYNLFDTGADSSQEKENYDDILYGRMDSFYQSHIYQMKQKISNLEKIVNNY